MKTFDWAVLFERNPLFMHLGDEEQQAILSDEISSEREFPADAVILDKGESGDSVYLIGSGAVSVELFGPDDERVALYTLKEGELFGEMAVFDQRPRSATVTAKKPSVVLEIDGSKFLSLVAKHHEIALHLLSKLSQRLRHTDEEILTVQMQSLNDSVGALTNRVDAIVQATDAKLAASQAIFEQTNTRANEVITSADRARARLTWLTSTAGTVLVALVSLGLWDLSKTRETVQADKVAIESDKNAVKSDRAEVQKLLGEFAEFEKEFRAAKTATDQILQIAPQLWSAKRKADDAYYNVLLGSVKSDLVQGSGCSTANYYKEILMSENDQVKNDLIARIDYTISAYRPLSPATGDGSVEDQDAQHLEYLSIMLKSALYPQEWCPQDYETLGGTTNGARPGAKTKDELDLLRLSYAYLVMTEIVRPSSESARYKNDLRSLMENNGEYFGINPIKLSKSDMTDMVTMQLQKSGKSAITWKERERKVDELFEILGGYY